MKKVILFLILSSGLFVSCLKDKVEPLDLGNDGINLCPDTISYQAKIKTIVDVNCSTSGCHNASNAGGITLLSHAQVKSNATKILETIRHASGVTAMPFGGAKLSDEIINDFSCWAAQGTLDN